MTLNCTRCGHSWENRTRKPISCPKCKSPYWNKLRVKRSKAVTNSDILSKVEEVLTEVKKGK